MKQQAFVLRISRGGIDMVEEALDNNQITIGWSRAAGLLEQNLIWEEFREIIKETYYPDDENFRRAGAAGGHMRRFIRKMSEGDLVVVPHHAGFYVAQVAGPATYNEALIDDDTAYRREVEWLNGGQPIPRALARAALIMRMKTRSTSADASDLLSEINSCLEIAQGNRQPTFWSDWIERLTDEIRDGRMDNHRFELLVCRVLESLGAHETRVVPRIQDHGADIIARFTVAGVIDLTLAIQVKHWQPDHPIGEDIVEQLINGIQEEETPVNLGMIVTSGTISEAAEIRAEQFFAEEGIKIEMVDGELLAKLIMEHGVKLN